MPTDDDACLHDWQNLGTIAHGAIDDADPVLHTSVVILGCVSCRTVDLIPASNAALLTQRFLDALRQTLSADGWQLPPDIAWIAPPADDDRPWTVDDVARWFHMPDSYILDDDGEPVAVDLLTATAWFETHDRTILHDAPSPTVDVSTVFLSFNHQWRDGPPVLWETMIFGGVFDQYQRRYTTKLDALTGHAHAVQLVDRYATAPRRIRKAVRHWQIGTAHVLRSRNIRRRLRRMVADIRC